MLHGMNLSKEMEVGGGNEASWWYWVVQAADDVDLAFYHAAISPFGHSESSKVMLCHPS
jgi:hypothetical protein